MPPDRSRPPLVGRLPSAGCHRGPHASIRRCDRPQPGRLVPAARSAGTAQWTERSREGGAVVRAPSKAWSGLVEELVPRMSPEWIQRGRENADQTWIRLILLVDARTGSRRRGSTRRSPRRWSTWPRIGRRRTGGDGRRWRSARRRARAVPPALDRRCRQRLPPSSSTSSSAPSSRSCGDETTLDQALYASPRGAWWAWQGSPRGSASTATPGPFACLWPAP
jgi:hypothetical protein